VVASRKLKSVVTSRSKHRGQFNRCQGRKIEVQLFLRRVHARGVWRNTRWRGRIFCQRLPSDKQSMQLHAITARGQLRRCAPCHPYIITATTASAQPQQQHAVSSSWHLTSSRLLLPPLPLTTPITTWRLLTGSAARVHFNLSRTLGIAIPAAA